MFTSKEGIINAKWTPWLIIALGVLFRFSIGAVWGYSNDELSAVVRTFYDNYHDLIQLGVKEKDFHPAGVQLFITFWQSIFGTSEWITRLPFITVGCLGLLGYFHFFKLFWDRKIRLLFLVFAAFLFFPIEHTVFARPYAFGLFFTGMVLYCFYEFKTRETIHWQSLIGMGIAWTGILYSHYFAALFAVWLAVCLAFLLNKKQIFYFILTGAFAGIAFIPHVGITLYHLNQGGLGWLPPPTADFLHRFLFHIANESWILVTLLIPLIIFGIYFGFKNKNIQWKGTLFSLLIFLGIYGIGFYFSITSTPILKFMVLLFPFPFLLIFFTQWLSWTFDYIKKWTLPAFTFVLLLSTIIEKSAYNDTQHFGVFRQLAEKSTKWNQIYGDENITHITNLNSPQYVNFYINQIQDEPIHFERYNLDYKNPHPLDSIIRFAETKYFSYSYSTQPHPPQYHEMIRDYFPTLIEGNQYFNAGIWLFSNEKSERVYKYTFEFPQPTQLTDSAGWKILPPGGFTPAEKFPYKEIDFNNEDYLLFIADVFVPDSASIVLVGTGQNDENKAIESNGIPYYIGQGNNGKKGHLTLKNAFPIQENILKHNDSFVFYLWNNGDKPILIKSIDLHLVDPEM